MTTAHPSIRDATHQNHSRIFRPRSAAVVRRIGLPLIAILLLVSGCATDTGLVGPARTDIYPAPATPDLLMENFALAFTARDLDRYASLLHEDFVFGFSRCDPSSRKMKKGHLDRDEELAAAGNLFSGKPRVKADGRAVPAITGIRFVAFSRVGEWKPSVVGKESGSLKAIYDMDVEIGRADGSVLVIRGRNVFFVTVEERPDWDGRPKVFHRLVGWVELAGGCPE